MKKLLLLQAVILLALCAFAQPLPPYRPDRAEILQRYRKARYLDSIATRSIFRAAVRPHWAADNNSFWYWNIGKDSVK